MKNRITLEVYVGKHKHVIDYSKDRDSCSDALKDSEIVRFGSSIDFDDKITLKEFSKLIDNLEDYFIREKKDIELNKFIDL